jgi:hypothetical protein
MSRLRSEANRVLRYALGDTFQVVVGKVPSQKHFTLYTSIMSQHSEFFRAASADPTKPVELDDHDPEIFKAYLCCLLGGVHAIKADVEDEIPDFVEKELEDQSSTETQDAPPVDPWSVRYEEPELPEDAFTWTQKGCERLCAEGQEEPTAYENACSDHLLCLAKIYVEADKLLDLGTANQLIDELIRFGAAKGYNPDDEIVNFVYESTVHGSPLRKLMRDLYMYSTGQHYMYLTPHQVELPAEFYRDLFVEYLRVKRPQAGVYYMTTDFPVNSVIDKMVLDNCEYHLHDENLHPKDECRP